MTTLLVTGGAGFIGSNFVRQVLDDPSVRVVNLDLLTYAGNRESVDDLDPERHIFVQGDVGDRTLVKRLLAEHKPDGIVHFAAESHVDRSIDDPTAFIRTNVFGTQVMLDCALDYWKGGEREAFRFVHVSTDEVYGTLGPDDAAFDERHRYAPNSPYAASKASADHLARAWHRTYGLPVMITNCSNNYGPYQFPEKLIPLMLINALEGERLPVYGDGQQRRDWLFVGDHCSAIQRVLTDGQPGRVYNVGGNAEMANLDVVHLLCDLLDERVPGPRSRRELIDFVQDRPGHDRRYAVNASRISEELGWSPSVDFAGGLARTVDWYLEQRDWWQRIRDGRYRSERLGTAESRVGAA